MGTRIHFRKGREAKKAPHMVKKAPPPPTPMKKMVPIRREKKGSHIEKNASQ